MGNHRRTTLLLAAILLGLGCQPQPSQPEDQETVAPAPPVQASPLQVSTLMPSAQGTAEIEADRSATLRAEAAGRVTWIGAKEGEQVKKGQNLIKLDIGRTTAQLKAAQTATAQAEAQLAQSRREREMADRLAKQGSMAKQALDRARDAEHIAEAAVESARARAGVTRRGLKEAVVTAPFAGTIITKHVEIGEFLSPGTPVLSLVDASSLKAQVLLDPREALDVQAGAGVSVHVYARGDEVFQARVTRVGEVVDARSRKLPVEIAIDDPTRRLRPGLVARLEVQVGEPRQALMVDEDAIFERFGQHYLYVLEGTTARRRPVKLGVVRHGRVELLEGAKPGELIIIRGIDRVVDGREVHVVDAPRAEAR